MRGLWQKLLGLSYFMNNNHCDSTADVRADVHKSQDRGSRLSDISV